MPSRAHLGTRDADDLRAGRVVQRRLEVGRADDPLEHEADKTADAVMKRLTASVTQEEDHRTARRVLRSVAKSGAIGAEGGPVDRTTERQINASRGKRLGAETQATMESAFGADFSSVRIHTGPKADALNERLSARAFTSGADVFVRSGDYAPKAPPGQRIIAHELAHVVQQGAAKRPIRRQNGTGTKEKEKAQSPTTTLNIGAPTLPGQQQIAFGGQPSQKKQGGPPQRKPPPVPTKPLPKSGPKSKVGPKGPAPTRKPPPRPQGPVSQQGQWQTAQPSQGVQQSTPMLGTNKTGFNPNTIPQGGWQPEPTKKEKTIGGAHKRTAQATDVVTGGLGAQDTALLTQTKQSTSDDDTAALQQRTEIQVAAAPFALGGSLIMLGESIRKLFKADEGWDRFKAGMDVGGAALKGGAQIANVVDKSAQQQKGYGKGLGKQVGGQGKSESAVGAISMTIIVDIFNNVKDNVVRIKEIIDKVKESKKTELTTKEKWDETIKTAEAISKTAATAAGTAKNIMSMTSGVNDAIMQAVPGLGIAVNALSVIKRAVEYVLTTHAFFLIREKKRGLKAGSGWVNPSSKKPQHKQIEDRGAEIENQLKTGNYDPAEKQDLEDELADIKLYKGAKLLQKIDEKRMNRQGILISTDVANIVADALVLSGVGAAAGGGVKAAAAAVKAALPGLRTIKQWGRDKAAKQTEGGQQGTVAQKLFNPQKSSAAKAKQYEQQVNLMLNMLSDLTLTPDEYRADMVKAFFTAAGMSWGVLQRYADANELGKELYSLLKKRE